MTDAPVSALRRRMIEDMTSRRLAPKTQEAYIRAVKNFTVFFGRSPDQANAEDLRRYHLHLASGGTTTPKLNAAVSALRVRVIQVLLGHKKLDTTALYSQVATRTIREVKSPLDQLATKVPPPA